MALLGRLGALLQRAVQTEEQEPRLDLPAAFKEHWQGVTQYYLETSDENKPAKETDIPWHLKQMLDILVYEEKQQPSGETGPCLEYLLQHKILETLGTLGKAEYPPGMRSQVLLFFGRLLGQMQRPLLHFLNVYRPVQKLLRLGCDAFGPVPEKEMVQLVAVLCAKIKQEPTLLPYILEGKDVAGGQRMDPLPCTLGTAAEPALDSCKPLSTPVPLNGALSPKEASLDMVLMEPDSPTPNLVTSLISLCMSKKSKVALRAQETLLLLTSTDHQAATQALIQDSRLGLLVADHLQALYDAIPATVSPADVATFQPVSWRLQSRSPAESSFPEQPALEAFFGWLDLCECLVKGAHPSVASAVSRTVGQRFFVQSLRPQLLQMSEHGILISTAIMTRVVKQTRAPALLQELVAFVLEPEEEVMLSKDPVPQRCTLCFHLIERCNHLSDEISIATLRLFEELLWLPDERIVHHLVLHYLQERNYIQRSPLGQEEPVARELEPCEDGLELEEDPYFMDGFPDAPFQASRRPAISPVKRGGQPGTKVDVMEMVSSFLCLVPGEAKTSTRSEEAGYDTYVHDAKALFRECSAIASHWNWPLTPCPKESCTTGATFFEGHFLKVLFDRLTRILDQPYAVNLQVTSVLSRLALFPHPHLHEYLLDPYLALGPGCRSLFSVLIRVRSILDKSQPWLRLSCIGERLGHRACVGSSSPSDPEPQPKAPGLFSCQVIGDLMQRTHRIPNFTSSLLLVRRRLVGLVPEEQPISHQKLLEGVIVLEEFCKELAAIVFVKSMAKSPA